MGIIARRFGISEGTVEAYTYRTIVTLLSIETVFFKWPDTAENNSVKQCLLVKSGFLDCIGLVDGELIVLA